jgi:hypothetical protein
VHRFVILFAVLDVERKTRVGRTRGFFWFRKTADAGIIARRGAAAADAMPVLPIARDFHDGADPERARVLALRRVRRGMECVAAQCRLGREESMAVSGAELTRDLQELIAALDRRLPGVEHAGEVDIARDAAALRDKAIERLAQLTGTARAECSIDYP